MIEKEWVHQVSFDDLAPSMIDDEVQYIKHSGHHVGFKNRFIHIPPQFNPLYGLHHTSASGDWSSSSSSLQGLGMSRTNLRPRLPPPPVNSSLRPTTPGVDEPKNAKIYDLTSIRLKDERQIMSDTQRNTERNSGSRSGYTQDAFSHLNEPEDTAAAKWMGEENKNPRRKSFAGMSDEELSKLEDYYASRGRSSKLPAVDKFDFHEQAPIFIDDTPRKGIQAALVDPLTPVYPSRPVVDHRAISLTKQHKDYTAERRTVSCYISGRRHTWSAADWYVENEVMDGDHFVVVTTISRFEDQLENEAYQQRHAHLSRSLSGTGSSYSNGSSPSYMSPSPLSLGLQICDIHMEAKLKCRNILNYYATRLGNKCVKITVEMVKEDSTKTSITKTVALYKPDLQIISTVSTNIQIKFKNGNVKLPNFLMRHYAMPTCIIPYEFIDPKLLREDAGVPATEKERRQRLSPLPASSKDRLDDLDKLILKTLKNPYETSADSHKKASRASLDSNSSVEDYFPPANEQKRKIERFESLGYVKPKPSRPEVFLNWGNSGEDTSRKTTRSNSSISRSSRLYSDGGAVYKVKSLVDGLGRSDDTSSHDGTLSRKSSRLHPHKPGRPRLARSKTTEAPPRHTSGTPANHKSKSLHKHKTKDAHSLPTSPTPGKHHGSGKHEKKHGGHLGTFFKKLFG
ncbi:uncharacterized protein ZBAI_09679 [Zygosaccharomyces bailii ISA1307]|nr:uncharacterized protein ZBAI_09679 [Zygosaccharomyces bailii ISA1307]